MDHHQIQTLICRYADLLYAREWDKLPDIFTADAHWEIEGSTYVLDGAEVPTGLRAFVEPASLLLQILSPAIIEINGDEASARTSVHEIVDNPSANMSLNVFGIYFDKIRKVDGEWRFASRSFRQLKTTVGPYEAPAA